MSESERKIDLKEYDKRKIRSKNELESEESPQSST
jgi:hypothetical protein